MYSPRRFAFPFGRAFIPVFLSLLLILACGPGHEPRPTGLAGQYDDAKVMFKRGKFDRSLDFTDGLIEGSSPNQFTERARVLRAVIFTGLIHGYKYVTDAYSKGSDSTKDPQHKAAFLRQRHDCMQLGGKRALDLGEVTQQLIQGDVLPKELTLEAPYPTTEGPIEVKDLVRISEGGWVESGQQDAALVDAVSKGVDESLADVIGGDRAKARAVLASGSAKLEGADFSLYLGHAILEGASFFDRKHIHDPQKFSILLNLADGSAKAGLALLKDNPNKDKEAELKKLQDQIKTALKSA